MTTTVVVKPNVVLATSGTVSSNAVKLAKAINTDSILEVKRELKKIYANATKEWDASKYPKPEEYAGLRKQLLDKHLCCVVRNINSKKVGLVHNVGYAHHDTSAIYLAVIVLDENGVKNTTWSTNSIEPIGMSASEYIEFELLNF